MKRRHSPSSSESGIVIINSSSFTPPKGGDVVLKSSDGVEFRAHTAILKIASPIFDAMLSGDTTEDPIEVSEDAKVLSTILQFVYPAKTPIMADHDMLADCLLAIRKYNIHGALENLDQQISLNAPPHLLASDPVRVYTLALKYKLHTTKRNAGPLVTPSRLDFCDLDAFPQLAQTYRPSELLRLTIIQAMRFKVLSEVLFTFDKPPMLPEYHQRPGQFARRSIVNGLSVQAQVVNDGHWKYGPWYFSCRSCYGDSEDQLRQFKYIPTTWTLAWARLVHKTLLDAPLGQSGFLFDIEVFSKFRGEASVCMRCLDSLATGSRVPESEVQKWFKKWVGGVKDALVKKLEGLENVYAI